VLLGWGPAGAAFAEPRGVSARPAAQPRARVKMHGAYNRFTKRNTFGDGQYITNRKLALEDQDLQGYVMFEEMEKSMFDGNQEKKTIIERYWGKKFVVRTDTWEYELYKDDWEKGWPTTGLWSKDFRMPINGKHGFIKRERELRGEYAGMVKKLFKRHSRGWKYPNGKAVHLTKLQHIPFTREIYGEKYAGKAPWLLDPREVPLRKRQLEANRLKRRLEQEAELLRVKRLRDLGIYAGEQEWRRPWQPQVDLLTGELLEELQDVSLPDLDEDEDESEDESEDEDE